MTLTNATSGTANNVPLVAAGERLMPAPVFPVVYKHTCFTILRGRRLSNTNEPLVSLSFDSPLWFAHELALSHGSRARESLCPIWRKAPHSQNLASQQCPPPLPASCRQYCCYSMVNNTSIHVIYTPLELQSQVPLYYFRYGLLHSLCSVAIVVVVEEQGNRPDRAESPRQ
ncbi:hypothetical protein E2C01_014084 [Portunus trituberculatus]|uniref:Uncharacterized protein n=1 Tax=Portunus trituberculatus TaxID=210409 RepID=A0A5B7DJ68_PORTR|nr:hypothetical protein [Portunus trituberculatus]